MVSFSFRPNYWNRFFLLAYRLGINVCLGQMITISRSVRGAVVSKEIAIVMRVKYGKTKCPLIQNLDKAHTHMLPKRISNINLRIPSFTGKCNCNFQLDPEVV